MGFESRISKLDFKPRGEKGRQSRLRRHLPILAVTLAVTGTATLLVPRGDDAAPSPGAVIEPSGAATLASLGRRTFSLDIPALDTTAAEPGLAEQLPPIPPAKPELVDVAPSLPPKNTAPEPQPRPIAEAPAAAPAPPVEPVGRWESVTVEAGDSLAAIFAGLDLGAREVYDVIHADEQAAALTRIFPGDTLDVKLGQAGELLAVRYKLSETETLLVRRAEEGFSTDIRVDPLERRIAHTMAVIDSSFYVAGVEAGLSDRVIMELAHIFGWDIDFALDIRGGDSFAVVYEELYRDGEKVRDGEILAVEFINQGERFRAVRYTDPEGETAYYTPEGKSMRKAFLRTPLNFAYVSSDFNPDRLHPILGYKRPHMGTDYAARTGTPIKAAGDGRIIHLGRKGGYGNAIVIKHGSRYSTLYGHMSDFRDGLHEGDYVKQGQVIGYVGSSGLATGPHLHYEFRINGEHVNPRTVKLPDADPIPEELRADFETQTAPRLAQLKTVANTMLAQRPTE